jgi:energy-coupling factor transporter ATP-binding protein EcfA2
MSSEPPETDGLDLDAFAGAYRAAVARRHETIRGLGLSADVKRERGAPTRIRLRDIFVPLRFHVTRGDGATVTLAHALARGRSVVVIGDPGAGKSTLLAYLALLHAGQATLDGLTPPERKVPLLIALSDFARAHQAAPGFSFLDYLTRHAASDLGLADVPSGFFESVLSTGRAVVLLDGLDEVGRETARHRIVQAVRAFRAAYPACSFWVTSRIHGYTRDIELSSDLDELTIAPLDDAQVSAFIERWYAIHVPDDPRARDERSASLVHAVHRSANVRRLANSPLLLTLMAFLHRSLGRLPEERGELYELCIGMLLHTWQGERPHLGLHVAAQKDYLAHLALYAQERNDAVEGEDARGLVGEVEALDCLARRHLEKSRRARLGLGFAEAREEMNRFLEYLVDETGILVNRGHDKLAFVHVSFQEYLAAWVFLCSAGGTTPSFFVKHLGSPAWEEVLLLRLDIVLRVPGGGGEEAFDGIVRVLLDRLQSMHFEPGWMTLARAVRDDLAFAPADRETVLRKASDLWAREGRFDGAWFEVLEQIALFVPRGREALREVLGRMAREAPSRRAEACARLHARFFGALEERAAAGEAHLLVEEPPPGQEVLGAVVYHARPEEKAPLPEEFEAALARAPEVVEAARREGKLSVDAAMGVLDEIEMAFGAPGEARAAIATIGVAKVYADAIWQAFADADWPEADVRAFADAVLGRAGRHDAEERDFLLDVTLRLLGAQAAVERFDDVPPTEEERERHVTRLGATKMWAYLRAWASQDGRRRGIHARAVRYTCWLLDKKGGAGHVHSVSLLRAVGDAIQTDPRAMLFGPEIQCIEILSARWDYRPLARTAAGVMSPSSQATYSLNFEDMLVRGARLLAGQAANMIGDEQWWSYPYEFAKDEMPMTVSAPPEALLLRAQPAAKARIAPTLAFAQGRHDGRAYDLLSKIAKLPEAEEDQDAYARMTIVAPWRLVREDPAWIASWRWTASAKGLFDTFPASLDDLREMLSEPPGPLPSGPEADLSSILAERIDTGGVWADRIDMSELVRNACMVPGTLPWMFVVWRLAPEDPGYAEEIHSALSRAAHPDEMSAVQLASDLFFLRAAAAHRPLVKLPEGEIDIRERLPEIFVSLLDAAQKEPPPGTLAAAEAPILRLCARAVDRLAGPDSLDVRDRLWLTYRLFGWLNLQLDRMPRDARLLGLRALLEVAPPPPKTLPPNLDLLDPNRFDRARFDHRAAFVIFALGMMEALVTLLADDEKRPKQAIKPVSSADIERRLAQLASKPLSDDERALRHREEPSCLGWEGPATIPEAALVTLLGLNEEAFFLIEPDARGRWLHELPKEGDPSTHVGWFLAKLILTAIASHAKKLSAVERAIVESTLRVLGGPPEEANELQLRSLAALFEAGAAHLAPEVSALLEHHLADSKVAPSVFGSYLTGLARLAPDNLIPEAERILAAVEARGLDPVPFAAALARPIIAGPPSCIRPVKDCLRRLAAREPYKSSEPMKNLLGMLGVS